MFTAKTLFFVHGYSRGWGVAGVVSSIPQGVGEDRSPPNLIKVSPYFMDRYCVVNIFLAYRYFLNILYASMLQDFKLISTVRVGYDFVLENSGLI